MSKINVNGIQLYYEEHGAGEPLLLIEGLGYATWMWYRQVPDLNREYRVILFDNRGVGESDKPDLPYTIEMMAADAAGVLRSLGIRRAHILGVSMGGYIAQAFASQYPDLTHTLTLVCTSFGGPRAAPMPRSTLDAMTRVTGLTPEEAILQGMSVAFAPEFFSSHQAEVRKIAGWRLARPTPRYAWEHQFNAVARADLEERTAGIQAPTLILTGDADLVVPAKNSRLLADTIPGSRLVVFPGAGHLVFIEQATEFNREVLAFLGQHPMPA
ncbi:hypothetical protein SY88_17015 [Clostridiales bacterium PH28_bin88]|nr:hypothetical protein SY88_17015 [Clostridiales bacterium PH28_bin88]